MMDEVIDLGSGHTLRWLQWKPDRELNPQYIGIPDIPRIGAIVNHGKDCESGIYFNVPNVRAVIGPDRPLWNVDSWSPLTLSPSLLCTACGDHGFIQNGRWVSA